MFLGFLRDFIVVHTSRIHVVHYMHSERCYLKFDFFKNIIYYSLYAMKILTQLKIAHVVAYIYNFSLHKQKKKIVNKKK